MRREPVLEKDITYVGLDVSKRTIAVAIRRPGQALEECSLPNEPRAVARFGRRMKR